MLGGMPVLSLLLEDLPFISTKTFNAEKTDSMAVHMKSLQCKKLWTSDNFDVKTCFTMSFGVQCCTIMSRMIAICLHACERTIIEYVFRRYITASPVVQQLVLGT